MSIIVSSIVTAHTGTCILGMQKQILKYVIANIVNIIEKAPSVSAIHIRNAAFIDFIAFCDISKSHFQDIF